MVFENAILYLDTLGLTQVILPFVLIFTVLFALLMKIGIFTEPNPDDATKTVPSRKYNSIIALAIALLTVIPHVTGTYPYDADPIRVINDFLPGAVVLTVVIVVFLMLTGLLGGSIEAKGSPLVGIAGLLSVIGLIVVLWRALYPNTTPSWLYWLDNPNLQATIVIVLIMGIVVWFIAGDPTKKTEWKKGLRELYGGP